MNFIFFKELFSSQTAHALCWTLFHSLWQGLIFAFIAGLIIMLTRRSKPVLRYNILSALFALLVLATIGTFLYEQEKTGSVHLQNASVFHLVNTTDDYPQNWAAVNNAEKISPTQLLNGFFSQYAYLVVAIWFFILGAKSVKMIFTLFYTRHLKKYKSHEPPPIWKEELASLCRRLKITRPTTLLESEIIKLPVVFGHLKPIIFIPLGLLSNLTPELVEAILIHELAHIRRNDYLVNLAQNIIETLFFFNPAILWISSLIRQERESCCDDVAIAQTRNKKRYVEALISFKELSLYNHSRYAVSFPGNKNSFFNRVSRILQNKNYTLTSLEKGSLFTCCIVATLLVLAFARPIQPHQTDKFVSSGKVSKFGADARDKYDQDHAGPIHPLSVDTLPLHVLPIDTLPPQGHPAPIHSYGSAGAAMRQVIADLVSEKVVKDSAAVVSFGLTDTELVVNDRRQPEALHQKLKAKYGIHENYGWFYGPVKMNGTGVFYDLTKRRPTMPPPLLNFKLTPQVNMNENRESNRFASFSQIIDKISDDLVSEGVVSNRGNLTSFNLTNEFLEVNGKNQPNGIHEKLRKKYLVEAQAWVDSRVSPQVLNDPDFGIHYNLQTGSMGIGITRGKPGYIQSHLKTDSARYSRSRGMRYVMDHNVVPRFNKTAASVANLKDYKFLESMEASQHKKTPPPPPSLPELKKVENSDGAGSG